MPPRPRPRPAAISWTGIAYRATSYDVPLWSHPNRRSGRWNIAGNGCTQYFCLDANAPFAEILRHEDLRTQADAATYTTTIWQLRIDEGAVVDYSSFGRSEAAGFPAEALVEDDHERCQAEATWLRSRGIRGLLSPSAALPGSVNLTLFGPRVAIAWDASVSLASTIPAGRLTTGHPPGDLVSRVRYFGQPHSALVAYLLSRLVDRLPMW
jgi:RES domain-containing protein